jgi:hypothetical protein
MTAEQLLGFLRHGLTLIGGACVTKGFMDEQTMLELVGASMSIIGFAWSFISKKK